MEYKGYNIASDGTFGMKVIRSIGSGALPKALHGAFTTDPQARRAINVYVNSLEKSKDLDNMSADVDNMSASFGMPTPLGG